VYLPIKNNIFFTLFISL